MVLWYILMHGALVHSDISHQHIVFVASWDWLQCRPKSAAICACLWSTWWELQSDLQLVAACAEPGDTWERLCCELSLTVTKAGLK